MSTDTVTEVQASAPIPADISTAPPEPVAGGRLRNDWKDLLNRLSYVGIVRNTRFMAFCGILCVFYISNDQRTIQTQAELNSRTQELKELRWKYMDIKSKLVTASMEEAVIRKAANIGLRPLELPAYKISNDTLIASR